MHGGGGGGIAQPGLSLSCAGNEKSNNGPLCAPYAAPRQAPWLRTEAPHCSAPRCCTDTK